MRTVATLHAPVNVPLLQAALADAGREARVSIEGVGASARLVITAPSAEQAAEEAAAVPPAGTGG